MAPHSLHTGASVWSVPDPSPKRWAGAKALASPSAPVGEGELGGSNLRPNQRNYVVKLIMWCRAAGSATMQRTSTAKHHIIGRLQGTQEGHKTLVFSPPPCSFVLPHFEQSKDLSLHLHVNLRINVRGIERSVAKPFTDTIDVHSSLEKMCPSRMPQSVRAHSLVRNAWNILGCSSCMSFNEAINSESREGLATAIEKHMLGWWPASCDGSEFTCRVWP